MSISLVLRNHISTHILTRRMTVFLAPDRIELLNFNSHPHKEDDQVQNLKLLYAVYFNSHPHKEDDDSFLRLFPQYPHFNSHPHKEDDGKI